MARGAVCEVVAIGLYDYVHSYENFQYMNFVYSNEIIATSCYTTTKLLEHGYNRKHVRVHIMHCCVYPVPVLQPDVVSNSQNSYSVRTYLLA